MFARCTEYYGTVLKGGERNDKTLTPPPIVAINRNHICLAQKALLEKLKTNTSIDNLYAHLRDSMVNISLVHDGIYRFSRELNGTFVPMITSANQSSKMPRSLKEIDSGSLNIRKLVNCLIQQILSISESQFEKTLIPK